MSNLWTAIAFKATPCARPAQTKPLLQLFNGYARYQSRRYSQPGRQEGGYKCSVTLQASTSPRRAFSTTTCLAARGKRPPRPPAPLKYDAKYAPAQPKPEPQATVEPAPTVASHTEGLPPAEEDEGITWRDYDPEGGMPLPNGEREPPEINGIFGNEDLDADTGNYVLNVMYWRRQSGALIDSGLDFPRRSGISREQALKALEYVRSLDPGFDEQQAGQVWAEEESLRMQEEIQERSIKLGLYKRDPEAYEEEEESQQGTPEGRQRSGESVLRTHREEAEAKWEKEQAEMQAKKERDELAALYSQRGPLELAGGVQPPVALTTLGPGGITIGEGPRSAWLAPVERKPWVKYYEEQAQIIKENILPRISLVGRLGPSLLVALATLAFCLFLSNNYTPPPKSARLWPDTPPAVSTMSALTILLLGSFIASRMPPFWKFLSKYMSIVPAYPHAASMLGHTLRHDTLTHLAVNTAVLWSFGLSLHEDVGRGTFLAILVASGCVGGFSSLTYLVLTKQWASYAFGSSGAVLGVAAATCVLHPNGTLKAFGVELPFAAWVLLAAFGAGEVYAVLRGLRTGVDHLGHLGGMATGMASALYVRQKAAGRGREEGRMASQPATVQQVEELAVDLVDEDEAKR